MCSLEQTVLTLYVTYTQLYFCDNALSCLLCKVNFVLLYFCHLLQFINFIIIISYVTGVYYNTQAQ